MIQINHLSKKYKHYTIPFGTLKGFALHYRQYLHEASKIDELSVIEDLNMTVNDGEVLCIIGQNGSGKSTLAKMIAGTVEPDSGSVHVTGKIVPFLELGVAFNAELSGRDNVFLNGVLLGMSRNYLKTHMDDIFRFAEVEDFKDTPIKFYSSGMTVRLAFSIGIHAQGDVYIFDEILAVGDSNFQKKCYQSFHNLIEQRKTILLITHDINTVKKYATMILKLENSKYRLITSKEEIQSL